MAPRNHIISVTGRIQNDLLNACTQKKYVGIKRLNDLSNFCKNDFGRVTSLWSYVWLFCFLSCFDKGKVNVIQAIFWLHCLHIMSYDRCHLCQNNLIYESILFTVITFSQRLVTCVTAFKTVACNNFILYSGFQDFFIRYKCLLLYRI